MSTKQLRSYILHLTLNLKRSTTLKNRKLRWKESFISRQIMSFGSSALSLMTNFRFLGDNFPPRLFESKYVLGFPVPRCKNKPRAVTYFKLLPSHVSSHRRVPCIFFSALTNEVKLEQLMASCNPLQFTECRLHCKFY